MSKCRQEGGSGISGQGEGSKQLKHEELHEGQKCPLVQGEGSLGQVMTCCETEIILPLPPSFGVSPALGVSPSEVPLTGQCDKITAREHGIAPSLTLPVPHLSFR